MTAAGDLRDAADELERYPVDVVRHGVDLIRSAVGARLVKDTGGDRRLSGDRYYGGRLSVSGKVTELGLVEGRVFASPRQALAPWRWLNDGTRPHPNDKHPGTRPKMTFDRPVADTLPAVEREAVRAFDRLELLR